MDEIKRSYYAIIPANIRYDTNVTPNAKLLYGEITALCNEKGFCWASNDYFAKLYGVSKQSVSSWISLLEKFKYISREIIYKDGGKEILNRYIKILAYPIQENLNTPIQENLKDNNTVINNTLNTTSNNICAFEELWSLYPRKKERARAFKNYQTRLKEGFTHEELLNAVLKYSEECKKNQTEDKYIKHCATFLGPNTPFVDYLKEGDNIANNRGNDSKNQPDDSDDFISYYLREENRDMSDL